MPGDSLCIETVVSQLMDANTSRPKFCSVFGLVGADFPGHGNALSLVADNDLMCFTLF